MDILLVGISLALAFYVAWSIGANDETMALVAGSGIASIGFVVFIGAVMDFFGAMIFSYKVEETLGERLLSFNLTVMDVLIIVFAIATWLLVASYMGWPVSTTHSAVGAAIGLGLYRIGFHGVNWNVLSDVVLGWVFSPLIGFIGSYVIILVVSKYYKEREKGFIFDLRTQRAAALLLLLWASLTAFSRGANDVANATAFLLSIIDDPFLVRLIGGGGMAIGLFILGRRVVRNVGSELVELDPLTGFSVQMATALILTIGTYLGLPLSGTHILVSAIAGVGLAKKTWINTNNLGTIILTWLATFPGAAIIAFIAALIAGI